MTQDNRVPLMFEAFAQVRDDVLALIADWSTEDVRNIQIMVTIHVLGTGPWGHIAIADPDAPIDVAAFYEDARADWIADDPTREHERVVVDGSGAI